MVSGVSPDTDAVFRPLLDDEVQKITRFYELQERKLLGEVSEAWIANGRSGEKGEYCHY